LGINRDREKSDLALKLKKIVFVSLSFEKSYIAVNIGTQIFGKFILLSVRNSDRLSVMLTD
jgi:hypothetical protein